MFPRLKIVYALIFTLYQLLVLVSVALPALPPDLHVEILGLNTPTSQQLPKPKLTLVKRVSNSLPYNDQLQRSFEDHTSSITGQLDNDNTPEVQEGRLGLNGRRQTAQEAKQHIRAGAHYSVAEARSALLRRLHQEYNNGKGISLERVGETIQSFESQVAAHFGQMGRERDSILATSGKSSKSRNQPGYHSALEKEMKPELDNAAKAMSAHAPDDAIFTRNIATSSALQSTLKSLGSKASPTEIGWAAMSIIDGEYWPKGLKALPVMGRA